MYRPETCCIRFALKFCVFWCFEVYFKQNSNNIIFTTIFATFYFEIAVKWSKSQIFKKLQLEHAFYCSSIFKHMGLVAYHCICLINHCLLYNLIHFFSFLFYTSYGVYFNVNYSLFLYGSRVWNKQLYYILHTTYYILYTTYYMLHTTYYILHTTYYMLHTTYYILPKHLVKCTCMI